MLDADKDEVKFLMSQCYLSTKATAKILFQERFSLPFSSLHDQIFEPLDNNELQQVVIIAPRGWGKTSISNLAYPAKKILFQEKKFIVPMGNTATQATMQSENLKMELMSNTAVNRIFGPIKSNTFSKEMWVTANGTAVMPRGTGQQIRGFLYGNYRPDLIIGDDLEDSESVKSEDQRQKIKEWFFADVMNSVNRASRDWKIVVIGTLLHEDSLLANLVEDPNWHAVHLSLCNDELKSNWPDFMDDSAIRKLYDSYKVQGLLDTFYREYKGVPIAKESAKFRQDMFKDYEETSAEFVAIRRKLENIVILDPAKTTTATADDTAIVGIGVDAETPRIYVRDIVKGPLHPEQQYTECFNMADRLGAKVIGIEVTSLNEFITYPLRTEMLRQKRYYDIVELKARAKKEDRIAALVPFYRLGFVYHNKHVCAALEAQLMSFPRSKKDDIMDALAYIIEMLELGERYFIPQESAEEEYKTLSEDDYGDQLEPLRDWRAA
jgi:phage terminase large subunit-like protein